jgi:hypothetical protein
LCCLALDETIRLFMCLMNNPVSSIWSGYFAIKFLFLKGNTEKERKVWLLVNSSERMFIWGRVWNLWRFGDYLEIILFLSHPKSQISRMEQTSWQCLRDGDCACEGFLSLGSGDGKHLPSPVTNSPSLLALLLTILQPVLEKMCSGQNSIFSL